jgi:hypothetical protein
MRYVGFWIKEGYVVSKKDFGFNISILWIYPVVGYIDFSSPQLYFSGYIQRMDNCVSWESLQFFCAKIIIKRVWNFLLIKIAS